MVSQESPAQNPDKKNLEPRIRTMESDIAEFTRKTKPSLIQLLTKQAEYQPEPLDEAKSRFSPRLIIIIVMVALGFSLMIWGVSRYLAREAAPPAILEETPLPSPITVEQTKTVTAFANAVDFKKALLGAIEEVDRPLTFKRVIIKLKGWDGGTRLLSSKDFFSIIDIKPPTRLAETLQSPLFIYAYYTSGGPRTILIMPIGETDRAFSGMFAWENAMQRDFEIMFLNESVTPVIAPFVDKIFNNIGYRALPIRPGLALSHFIFAPKKYVVITASEEAMQVTINRLLEAR